MATTRSGHDERGGKDTEFEFYLKSGLPSSQIVSMLELQKKDKKEIDAFIAKYDAARKKIAKLIKKFHGKIVQKYGGLETAELIKKGIKFATKYGFSEAEKEAFLRFVLKGDVDNTLIKPETGEFTEMSRFLGFTRMTGNVLDIKAQDQAVLNEIVRLYEGSRALHMTIKNQMVLYKDCGMEVIRGTFDKTKHNAYISINPVIAMMFVPKVECLENRMLRTDIGRMVVLRSQPYLRKFMGAERFDTTEIQNEFIYAYEMANDPNSLAFLGDESPIANLLKRYKVQINLWKNVSNLRQGKFFSAGDFGTEDFISDFTHSLSNYEYAYVDGPEYQMVQDETTILRKLLHIFAIRPTYTLISPLSGGGTITSGTFSAITQQMYINTPIVNIHLPIAGNQISAGRDPVGITEFLAQDDWIVEHKALTLRHRKVVMSRDVLFFHINRKYHKVDIAPVESNTLMLKYFTPLPMNITNYSDVNTYEIPFHEEIELAPENKFTFVSAIAMALDPSKPENPTASDYYAIIHATTPSAPNGVATYFRYWPSLSVVYNESRRTNFEPIQMYTDAGPNATLGDCMQRLSRVATILLYKKEL